MQGEWIKTSLWLIDWHAFGIVFVVGDSDLYKLALGCFNVLSRMKDWWNK